MCWLYIYTTLSKFPVWWCCLHGYTAVLPPQMHSPSPCAWEGLNGPALYSVVLDWALLLRFIGMKGSSSGKWDKSEVFNNEAKYWRIWKGMTTLSVKNIWKHYAVCHAQVETSAISVYSIGEDSWASPLALLIAFSLLFHRQLSILGWEERPQHMEDGPQVGVFTVHHKYHLFS